MGVLDIQKNASLCLFTIKFSNDNCRLCCVHPLGYRLKEMFLSKGLLEQSKVSEKYLENCLILNHECIYNTLGKQKPIICNIFINSNLNRIPINIRIYSNKVIYLCKFPNVFAFLKKSLYF